MERVGNVLPVHMPKRFSAFLVSILCIFPASTEMTWAAIRVGMLVLVRVEEGWEEVTGEGELLKSQPVPGKSVASGSALSRGDAGRTTKMLGTK